MNFTGPSIIEDMAVARVIESMEKTNDVAGLEAMKVGEEEGSKTLTRINAAIERLKQKEEPNQ
ncbi:hypothetical protein IT401_00965 [Candidatus Nomurabacteria bacterium]|nr:hypothetical protein [Candidatus Nomurabacteria bacterium]